MAAVEVRFLVDDVSVDNSEQMTALLENFDASASRVCGSTIVSLGVDVPEGMNPLTAIRAETLRLEKLVQLRAVDVDLDFVDEGEIAERLNKSRQIINLHAKGERGHDFPPPYGLPGGRRIWTWASIARWVRLYKPDWDTGDEPNYLSREQERELAAWLTTRPKAPVTSTWYGVVLTDKLRTRAGGVYGTIELPPSGGGSKWSIPQRATSAAR